MITSKQLLGKECEEAALRFLLKRGLRLVARNYSTKLGEIDLIMKDGEVLVFVEVRSKTDSTHGTPLETIDYAKRRRIEKVAAAYLRDYHISQDVFCRFDAVGITITSDGEQKLEYIENAFWEGE
ncbi:MAG: YraN family protein [Candidatus Riflebacteria bacterium]|nr:YraN family protein [Candidatus Riflebacteria bacterium]